MIKKKFLSMLLALCMTAGMLPTVAAGSLPSTASKPVIADGCYNLSCMGNDFNLASNGSAELRQLSYPLKYFVKHVADSKYTIKTANGKYLGVSEMVKDGVQIKAVDKEYLWTFRLESGSDTFSLRPAEAPKMILNASGEKEKDGTPIILWTYEKTGAPKHAKFRFTPTGYTIIFDANGGTGVMKNGAIDKNCLLPKNGFKKSGYKFVGWSTLKVATDESNFYEEGASGAYLSGPKGIVTLYAQWVKAASYKISYASVKGVKIPSNAIKKYTAGGTTKLPIASVTQEGEFAGWTITVKGKKASLYNVYEIPPYITGDITLTPVVYQFEG